MQGTLLDEAGYEQLVILHQLSNGLISYGQIRATAALLLGHASRYGEKDWKKDKAFLTGLEVRRLTAIAEGFVQGSLLGRIRPAMHERMAAHREAGDTLALLTGSIEIIARPLVRALGIPHLRATVCAVARGRFSSAPPLRHPYGPEKLALARDLADETGLPLTEAAAYADSVHDLPLLEAMARPVAVHPGPGLARAARRRGWEILAG